MCATGSVLHRSASLEGPHGHHSFVHFSLSFTVWKRSVTKYECYFRFTMFLINSVLCLCLSVLLYVCLLIQCLYCGDHLGSLLKNNVAPLSSHANVWIPLRDIHKYEEKKASLWAHADVVCLFSIWILESVVLLSSRRFTVLLFYPIINAARYKNSTEDAVHMLVEKVTLNNLI